MPLRHAYRPRLALAAVVLTAVVVGGIPALADEAAEERLEEVREDRDGAERELEATERVLADARARLAQVDEMLALRTSELARLAGELAAAEAAHATAVERLAEITARVRAAGAELDELVEEEERYATRLEERVAATYMHGGGAHASALVQTLLGVADLHDLSVGMRAVGAVLEDDRALVERTRELKRLAAERRAELAALRGERQDEEAAAQRARERVTALVRRQEQLVAEVETERAERAAIVRRVEADRELQRTLVAELDARISALAAELAARVRSGSEVRWDELDLDGPQPDWAAHLPRHGRRWAPAIDQAARQAGVDARLLAAVVWTESDFHPGAVSHAGAVGLAQLMPGTAARLGVDPRHPLQNLAGGATYLSRQLATFGSAEFGLAAYNAGPGAVAAHEGIPPYAETQLYVLTVLDRFQRLLR